MGEFLQWPLRNTWETHVESISLQDFPRPVDASSVQALEEICRQRLFVDGVSEIRVSCINLRILSDTIDTYDMRLAPYVRIHREERHRFKSKYIKACLSGETAFCCRLESLFRLRRTGNPPRSRR